MADDWQPVQQHSQGDDWQPVSQPMTGNVEVPPQPFLDRLARGDALARAIAPFTSAIKGFGESFGSEPLGLSPEHVQQLRHAGVFSDPTTGRGGALRFMNEAIGQQIAVLGDVATRTASGAVGAVAGAVRQFVEDSELRGSNMVGNLSPEAAENEVKNFGNFLMLRGDHEFGRIDHSPVGPVDTAIGTIPREQDFKGGAKLLSSLAAKSGDTAEFGKALETAAEQNLRDLWKQRGVHPAEAVHDALADHFLRQTLTEPPPTEEGGEPPLRAAGSDVTRDLPTLDEQPPAPPGRLAAWGRQAVDQLVGLARNIQFALDPMATGSDRAMVIAKDAMNSVRRIRWEHLRIDQDITDGADLKAARERTGESALEQQERLWNAADEESVLQQEGKTNENMGLATLEPEERAVVERLQERAQAAWLHARDTGMVEGDGLPAYTPRMVMNVAAASGDLGPHALNELGRNVFTRTSQMLHRKHLTAEETETAAKELVGKRMAERGASMEEIAAAQEKVKIARNIRALPMATARLEEAAIWRDMINKIEDAGKAAGENTIAVGFKPAPDWFTIAGHPSFTKWEPALIKNDDGTWTVRKDDAGNVLFVPKPIYMSSEFKGPMSAILDEGPSNNRLVRGTQTLYGALMSLKGKAMTVILNSPLIHNEVVWSKAMEAAGGREQLGFGLYFRGNRIVNNPGRSGELIERGLNPIGPRGSYQDITGMMEEPSLQGHQSWTAKLLSFIPGLFDEKAGAATERAIQKAGNFTHNTLLWDRVRDLQFGLADHLSDRLVAKGADRLTADRIATHFANIIVGSIPKESMSAAARATANMLLFSRSFTLGNLSTFKQAALGLPKDVLAQIERDHLGAGQEGITPEAAEQTKSIAKGIARRKAISTIMLSTGMYYVGNALIQHAFNIVAGNSSIEEEMNGYARRYSSLMSDVQKDPFELRHLLSRLSPTYDNEPTKQDRAHIGYAADGTAIYARNPTGKFGEEMVGYPSMPLEMLKRKLSPMAGGILEILENDKGFGRKIYDPNDTTVEGDIKNAFAIGKHLVEKHLPAGQIQAGMDLLHGEGDPTVNKLRLFAPMFGFTGSQGAPGGPARGEQLEAKSQFETRFNLAWPDIKKQIQRGDQEGARDVMTNLGVPGSMQNGLIRNAINPAGALHGRTLRDFYQYATPQQRQRLENAR